MISLGFWALIRPVCRAVKIEAPCFSELDTFALSLLYVWPIAQGRQSKYSASLECVTTFNTELQYKKLYNVIFINFVLFFDVKI